MGKEQHLSREKMKHDGEEIEVERSAQCQKKPREVQMLDAKIECAECQEEVWNAERIGARY